MANIPTAIWFSETPPALQASNKSCTPFTVAICASDFGPHIIDLYAQYSMSQPYQDPQNKWSHLVPQWRFLDLNGSNIDSILTTDTIMYSGTEAIGVTGYAQFYYVDDNGSTEYNPVIIWSTLQVSGIELESESHNSISYVPSYMNSMVATYKPIFVNGLAPHHLEITRNGVDAMSSSTYWVNQNVPNLITVNDRRRCFCDNADGRNIVFTYPSTNEVGTLMGPIQHGIIDIPETNQQWFCLDNSTVSAYFQAYDNRHIAIRGYSRNIVTPSISTLNTQITAAANLEFDSPYIDTPFIWVSHPNNHTLYKFHDPCISSTVIENITGWLAEQVQTSNIIFDTPYITDRIQQMALTGFGGIYGIAVDPCYNIWCSDSEMDKLYKFNYKGILLSTINLDDTTLLDHGISGGCTPAGICLDSVSGLWVSLFDSTSVLKFETDTGTLINIINPFGNQTYTDIGIDPDFKPTLAETDKNDNVWVSFTNSLCSCLYKYNENGNLSLTINLPVCSNPMDIIIDYDNNVWVSLTHHAAGPFLQGSIEKYDGTYGTQLSSISAVYPEYLTMDKTGNIWSTCDYNTVKRINNTTGSISNFILGTTAQPTWYNQDTELNYNCLEGIACDSNDRIWIINSYESIVYVMSGDIIINTYTLSSNRFDWRIDEDLNMVSLSSEWVKSIQAFGDWTGLRWYQKYAYINPTTQNVYLTGISDEFDIDSFNGYDVRKFNESWDATTQIHNYALPEHLYNNVNLFENYIGNMIGGLQTSANSIGRALYERIANYVPNHSDVDTSNVNQLYSLAENINVPIDDYNFVYPTDLKRMMDIVSIPHKNLWGERCKCAQNFKSVFGYCNNCGHKHLPNRGAVLDTTTYQPSANIPFLAEYKFDRNIYEQITPLNNFSSIFVASSGYLINDANDYCYYTYISTPCNVQVEGIISWDDEYTTLNENISGLNDWYGQNEIVEKMFNYILHKGLGF